MALFERPGPALLPLLPRVSFAALLRWELSDTYLSLTPTSSLTRTSDRSASTLFYFISDAAPNASSPHLTAVLARPPNASDFLFLSLSPHPHLTSTPTLLKLSFSDGTSPTRSLISLQHPAPFGPYLSLSGDAHASLVSTCSKRELFHLEYIPSSIAAGFLTPKTLFPFLHPAQALSYSLLQLGVRIRLRSIHGKLLTVDSGDNHLIPVVQHAHSSAVEEAVPRELVLTPIRIDSTAASGDHMFVFKDVDTGMALSIDDDNGNISKTRTLRETPVLLMEEKEAEPVRLRYGTRDWGVVHLGCGGYNGKEVRWLMAGPKGRLELRTHTSAWETFTVEFVRQSLDMALRELPLSPVFRAAKDETHAAVRREVVANVERGAGKADKGKKPEFDHSAALAGLSGEPRRSEKAGKGDNKKDEVSAVSHNANKNGNKVTGKKQDKRGLKVTPVAPSSSLPRNQANRKAAKRSKKQKRKAKSSLPGTDDRTAASSQPTVPGSKEQSKREATSSRNNGTTEGEKASSTSGKENVSSLSSNDSTSNASGPPCAACGRRLESVYTTALGKKFHPYCFCCGRCRKPMGAGAAKFRERGGIPYCQDCFASHLASRCARCSQPIMDTVITAMDKTWHKECLTCTICSLPLTQTFWLYADKPNEPRCSRCVTGSEEYNGGRVGSGRLVNIPLLGKSNTSLSSLPPPVGGSGFPMQGGRARLMHPVLPSTSKR